MNRDKVDCISTGRSSPPSNMSTTTLVSPSTYTSSQQQPYSAGWPAPSPTYNTGLISPPESRRTSDNMPIKEPPPPTATALPQQQRQSLPSIHEALSSGSKPNPYSSPVSATMPHPQHQYSYPQSQPPTIPRSYAQEPSIYAAQQRHPSPPQPIHPQANPFSRSESMPVSFTDPRHSSTTSLQTAPGPPPNPYAGRLFEPPRYDQDPRAPERLTNGYTHQPPPPQGHFAYPHPTSQVPQNGHPSFTEPRYQARDPREESWRAREEEKHSQNPHSGFKQGLKRHLDVWDFENNLATASIPIYLRSLKSNMN